MARRTTTMTAVLMTGALLIAACGGEDDPVVDSTDTTRPTSTDVAATDVATTDVPETDVPATEAPATAVPATEAPATDVPPADTVAIEPPPDPDDPPPTQVPGTEATIGDRGMPAGASYFDSTSDFEETVAALTDAIESAEPLTLVATIDHSANAEAAGLELAPTTELIFGNPMVGTPLMQAVPGVGIDLPQKFLVFERSDGTTRVMWNSAAYLSARHGLTGVDEQLTTIDGALAMLARAGTGVGDDVDPATGDDDLPAAGDGLVSIDAPGTAREAADRLLAAIESNENLVLVAEIDHAANAASVGAELDPIIEVVFGNPDLGTPLMQEARTIGLDLPQKMLFVETADGVTITYNDPSYLADRHAVLVTTDPIDTVTGALEMLAGVAAGS